MIRTLRNLRRNERGAAIVEFAFVAPAFLTLLMAGLDLGYREYLQAVIAGTVESVARKSAVGGMTSEEVDAEIVARVKEILPASSRNDPSAIVITKKSFDNFSNIGNPEKITSDTAPVGSYNVGDCYEDANRNGAYDASGGSTGIGGAEDVIYYKVDVAFPRLFPMAGLLGWSPTQSSTVNTIVRNQPYGAQPTPPVRCS
ncbi:pilus assembly protein [Chakrabartia godavariana]|nr:pilus assembly protein [Chakrabartia godavariana]